jgi:hypothetical protein
MPAACPSFAGEDQRLFPGLHGRRRYFASNQLSHFFSTLSRGFGMDIGPREKHFTLALCAEIQRSLPIPLECDYHVRCAMWGIRALKVKKNR